MNNLELEIEMDSIAAKLREAHRLTPEQIREWFNGQAERIEEEMESNTF